MKIHVARGARLKGFVQLGTDIDVDRELPVDYVEPNGTHYTYICSPKPEIDTRPVRMFLTPAAIPRRKMGPTSNWRPTRWGFPLGDADTADDTTGSFDGLAYRWPDLNVGQPIRSALEPVVGGRETTWVWSGVEPANVLIGVSVNCTKGKAVFLCQGDAFQISLYEKANGAAQTQTQTAFTWKSAGVDAAYRPRLCHWGYRISRTLRQIELLLNGVVVYRYELSSAMGWIVEAGPTVFGAGIANVAATRLVRDDREHFVGGPAVSIGIFGDSKSDSVSTPESPGRFPVQWPHYLPALLDGSGGIRVAALSNLAEAGTTMAGARARLAAWLSTAAGIAATVVIIFSGTNDIQAQTDPDAVYNDLLWMVTEARKTAKHVIVVGPDGFYSRDLVNDGSGVITAFSAFGAPIRAAIQQVAVATGCLYADGQKAIGLETPEWRNNEASVTKTRLPDILHGAGLYAAQMANVIAHEVMAAVIMPARGAVRDLDIPASAALSGYVIDAASRLDRSADGLVSLDMTVTAPAYGAADNIVRLPRSMWPRRRVESFVQYNNQRGTLIIFGLDDGNVAGLTQIVGLAGNNPAAPIKICANYAAAFA